MPNWCYNYEHIAGPREEVRPLYDRLREWIHDDVQRNGFPGGWLGNIVGHSGIEHNNNGDQQKYPCRGQLAGEFVYEEEENGEGIISFTTETAWAPIPETWYAVLKIYAPHAKYYYMAEESGMCIFESNDFNHRFFSDEFVISCSFCDKDKLPEAYKKEFEDVEDGILYDWDPDEVIGMMERITGMNIDPDNDEELTKLMQAFEEKTQEDLGNGDNFINVYKIRYYEPEEE